MILSPILNRGIEELGKKQFRLIIILLVFIESYGLYINEVTLGSDLLGLINIYLIGRYLRKYNVGYKRKCCFCLWLLATSTLVIILAISKYAGFLKVTWMLLGYCNPLIMIQAIMIFLFVIRFKPRSTPIFDYLGLHSLTIYLITENISRWLYFKWGYLYQNSPMTTLLYIMGICIFIVIADCPIDKISIQLRSHVEKILEKADNY